MKKCTLSNNVPFDRVPTNAYSYKFKAFSFFFQGRQFCTLYKHEIVL